MVYIISPITVFDEDKELWETHIAQGKSMELCYSVWAPSEEESRNQAEFFVGFLNENLKEYIQDLS